VASAFARSVKPGAGSGNGVSIQISAVDLHLHFLMRLIHQLAQQDGDGAGLFTAGTASNLDTEQVVIRFVLAQLRQDIRFQQGKSFRVTEKLVTLISNSLNSVCTSTGSSLR